MSHRNYKVYFDIAPDLRNLLITLAIIEKTASQSLTRTEIVGPTLNDLMTSGTIPEICHAKSIPLTMNGTVE